MIYVDPMMCCVPSRAWKWTEACHLFADHTHELHAFAANLGLKREWFQNKANRPHYDLTTQKRAQAVRLGALELTREEAVAKWRSMQPDPAQLSSYEQSLRRVS